MTPSYDLVLDFGISHVLLCYRSLNVTREAESTNSRKSHRPTTCQVRNVLQDADLCVTLYGAPSANNVVRV